MAEGRDSTARVLVGRKLTVGALRAWTLIGEDSGAIYGDLEAMRRQSCLVHVLADACGLNLVWTLTKSMSNSCWTCKHEEPSFEG